MPALAGAREAGARRSGVSPRASYTSAPSSRNARARARVASFRLAKPKASYASPSGVSPGRRAANMTPRSASPDAGSTRPWCSMRARRSRTAPSPFTGKIARSKRRASSPTTLGGRSASARAYSAAPGRELTRAVRAFMLPDPLDPVSARRSD